MRKGTVSIQPTNVMIPKTNSREKKGHIFSLKYLTILEIAIVPQLFLNKTDRK